jgi:Tfp pilus assembly protein FimT
MDELMGVAIVAVAAIFAYRYVYRWWRIRQTGKQADELLASIVKGKDSFRR